MKISELSKQEKIALINKLEEEKERKECLPHLHTVLYKWQRDFIDSRNKMNLMTAANQSGKSSAMIIKNIAWATEKELWNELWPIAISQNKPPTQFWYFYPDGDTLNREFVEKWEKEYLPRGKYKEEGKYAWKVHRKDKIINRLEFCNSGVTIYFFTYGQDASVVQASTVYMITVDEELPFKKFYGELAARISTTDGYFNSGFTATLGQEEWREAMEEQGTKRERFPSAFKQQINLYDCIEKEDGSAGMWSKERVQRQIEAYSTQNEILKRVYGRFVSDSDLLVSQFNVKRHFTKGHPLKGDWLTYGSIDPGSGGHAHPAGVIVLAVNAKYTKARVIKCWRGDNIDTPHSDIIKKYQELTKGLTVQQTFYDKQCRDLFLVAANMGIVLTPANKKREDGFGILNTLFKHDMLKIYYNSEDDETHKLKNELMYLAPQQRKTSSATADNLVDPLRYACIDIPWDFDSVINYKLSKLITKSAYEVINERDEMIKKVERGERPIDKEINLIDSIQKEISEWNSYYHDEDF